MKNGPKNIKRGVLIAIALLLLATGAVYAISEVVRDFTASVTLAQADLLSDSSLGVYTDSDATTPLTTVSFGAIGGFRYDIGQGLGTTEPATVPVYIKNQHTEPLLVGIDASFAQGTVSLVSASGGALDAAARTLNPNQILPAKLKLTPNASYTAGSYDFTIHFIGQTLISGGGLGTFTTLTTGLTGILEDIAFKPDGSFALIPARNDGNVYRYDGSSFTTLSSGVHRLNSVSWRYDGSEAIFTTDDADIATYDNTAFTIHESDITGLNTYDAEWTPYEGLFALVAGNGGTNYTGFVFLWINEGAGWHFNIMDDNGPRYSGVGWAPDGRHGVITNYDGPSFTIVNMLDVSLITEIPVVGATPLEDVAYKPDGSYALMVGLGGYVQRYDDAGWPYTPIGTVTPLTSGTTSDLYDVAWKPDGSYALIVGEDATLLKYDGASFTALDAGISSTEIITAVGWKPDGSYALLVTFDGTVVKFTP